MNLLLRVAVFGVLTLGLAAIYSLPYQTIEPAEAAPVAQMPDS